MTSFRYKAFISYSWADAAWGNWLHKALETYRTPKALIGRETQLGPAPARLLPLFKDREEQAAGADIAAALDTALGESEFLIVICSPHSARSQWVSHEIAWFKIHRDPSHILALIVEGEPGSANEECFSPALTRKVMPDLVITDQTENVPLAADARDSGDGRRRAKLKLAAAMLGVGLDELVRRDDRRRLARTQAIVAASLTLAAVMSGLAVLAIQARNQAEMQRGQAEGLVEFMIGDLRNTLESKVPLEVLGVIADRAKVYYDVQSRYRMDTDALGRRARMLDLLGAIEEDRGHAEASERLYKQSSAANGELLASEPDNPALISTQATSLQRLGMIDLQHGALTAAETDMREAVRLATRLVTLRGNDSGSLDEQSSALTNLAVTQLKQRKFDPAIANLQLALTIKRGVVGKSPNDRQAKFDLALTLAWAAEAATLSGDDDAALGDRQDEEKAYRALLAASPDDLTATAGLTQSRIKQATALLQVGQNQAALDMARQAADAARTSLSADPDNTSMTDDLAGAQTVLGNAELANGHLAEAARAAAEAAELAEKLAKTDPSNGDWNGALLGNARLLNIRVAARAASGPAMCGAALETVTAEAERLEALSAASPTDARLALAAARGQLMSGDRAALLGDIAGARTAWGRGGFTLRRAAGPTSPLRDRASLRLLDQIDVRLKSGITADGSSCG
jgi:tetratricopeptide (TPR) repeat protein